MFVLLCYNIANIRFKAHRLKLGRNVEVFMENNDMRSFTSFGVLTGRFGPPTPRSVVTNRIETYVFI